MAREKQKKKYYSMKRRDMMAMEKHKMRKMKEIVKDPIPDHLTEEILRHLPPKSLLRFKSLSKSWQETISSPVFGRAHLEKSKNKPPLIVSIREEISWILRVDKALFTVLTPEEHFKLQPMLYIEDTFLLESGCDGFLLLTYDSLDHASRPKVVLLWNPSTRKHKILTEPGIEDVEPAVRFGIGYDPSIDDYKIVKFVTSEESCCCKCEVFTLKRNEWRPLSYDLPCIISTFEKPVSVKGVMYWVAKLEGKPAIVCFDLANETFGVKLPPIGYLDIDGLMEYEGKLGCFCDVFYVWILEDQTWVRLSEPFTSETDVMTQKLCSSQYTAETISCPPSLISFD